MRTLLFVLVFAVTPATAKRPPVPPAPNLPFSTDAPKGLPDFTSWKKNVIGGEFEISSTFATGEDVGVVLGALLEEKIIQKKERPRFLRYVYGLYARMNRGRVREQVARCVFILPDGRKMELLEHSYSGSSGEFSYYARKKSGWDKVRGNTRRFARHHNLFTILHQELGRLRPEILKPPPGRAVVRTVFPKIRKPAAHRAAGYLVQRTAISRLGRCREPRKALPVSLWLVCNLRQLLRLDNAVTRALTW